MTFYVAKIPVREGDSIQFDDGPTHNVVDTGEFGDMRVVETEGERRERHIDWFYEKGAEADVVKISNIPPTSRDKPDFEPQKAGMQF